MEIFKKILARMPNNKAPGADLIIMLWIKRLSATHPYLLRILKEVMVGEADIPSWLAITKTLLIPKNQDTHQPENYRPIALQNNMFKVYTSILNHFYKTTVKQTISSHQNKLQQRRALGGVQTNY